MLFIRLLLLLIATSSNLERASAVSTNDGVCGDAPDPERNLQGYIIKLHLIISTGYKTAVNRQSTLTAINIVKEASKPFATLSPPVALQIIRVSHPSSRSVLDYLPRVLKYIANEAKQDRNNNRRVEANLYVVFVNGTTHSIRLGKRICNRRKRDRIVWISVNNINNPLFAAAPGLTRKIAERLGIKEDYISYGRSLSRFKPKKFEGVCRGFMGDEQCKVFSKCSQNDFKKYIRHKGDKFCLQTTPDVLAESLLKIG